GCSRKVVPSECQATSVPVCRARLNSASERSGSRRRSHHSRNTTLSGRVLYWPFGRFAMGSILAIWSGRPGLYHSGRLLLLSSAQRYYGGRAATYDGKHVLGPKLQGRCDLALVTVSVVNGFDAALDVVDRQFRDVWLDAQLAQVRAHGPSQIMQYP